MKSRILLMGKRVVFLWVLCLFSTQSFAQKAKFGKVSVDELQMESYEADPAASALVLFDVGRSLTDLNNSEGIKTVFTRHRRVKIFNTSGYKYADVEIPFFSLETASQSEWDDVYAVKAAAYELVDGKVVTHKMEKAAIFEERVNDFYSIKKFTIPNVSEGVVIEFTYKIQSDWVDIPGWSFQDFIPVKYSEYQVEYPDFCYFGRSTRGYFPFQKVPKSSRAIPNSDYSYDIDLYRAENVPAFQIEKYLADPDDYISRVFYQLKNLTIPGYVYADYALSWAKVIDVYMESRAFGKALSRQGMVDELVASLVKPEQSPEEKMQIIYAYVRDEIQWNEKGGYSLENGLRKTMMEKTGNVADKNLLLTLMLNAAGLDANPVLVSTRKHGIVDVSAPQYGAFNYVISSVRQDDKYTYLDASNDKLPLGMLPFKCMNGTAIFIDLDKESGENFSFMTPQNAHRNAETASAVLRFDEDMNLQGNLTIIQKGYNALGTRYVVGKGTQEQYIEENWKETGLNIGSYEIENLKEVAEPVQVNLAIKQSDLLTGDRIYLSPSFYKFIEENPFKLEKREYPVDFGTTSIQSYTLTLDIPEGFEVEEMPKNVNMALPDKAASFKFLAASANGKIQVRTSLIFKQAIFMMDSYPMLKQLYDLVLAKQAEQIVLKKVEE